MSFHNFLRKRLGKDITSLIYKYLHKLNSQTVFNQLNEVTEYDDDRNVLKYFVCKEEMSVQYIQHRIYEPFREFLNDIFVDECPTSWYSIMYGSLNPYILNFITHSRTSHFPPLNY